MQGCSPILGAALPLVLPCEALCPAPLPAPTQPREVPFMPPTSSAGSCRLMTLWAVTGQAWTTSFVRSHSQQSTGSSLVPMVRDTGPELFLSETTQPQVSHATPFPLPALVLEPPAPQLRAVLTVLQGENAPTGSSADSSTRSGRAAHSALWLTSSAPTPSSHPLGPRARTKVASGLHPHPSPALCPQSMSSVAWMGRS